MRKLFILLFVGFLLNLQPVFAKNQITFIYLNGSNTNTEQSREDYIKGVNKLHKEIVKHFGKNKFINEKFKDSDFELNPEPVAFYWGDKSKGAIESINSDFDILAAISPKPAQYVRKFIALCLHDAIWVSKMQNMHPIIYELHEKITDEYEKGNKVVLLGYSAGTFIVHEYLYLKMPVITINKSDERQDINSEFRSYIDSKNISNTCADAVFASGLITYDLDGNFVVEDNFDSFKKKIDSLNEYTANYCAPDGVLAGGINFASPFALFYSEIFDKEYKMSDIMAYSYKYIVENNMFWLTVNFSDDPLGFPETRNVTFNDAKEVTGITVSPNGGFIYDKSNKSSGRTFMLAHLSYFSAAKRFSKLLTEAISEGYNRFYMTDEE